MRDACEQHCLVRLELNSNLRIQIVDDGCGMPPQPPGLGSLRERAREPGVHCYVDLAATGGTHVCAWLPLT